MELFVVIALIWLLVLQNKVNVLTQTVQRLEKNKPETSVQTTAAPSTNVNAESPLAQTLSFAPGSAIPQAPSPNPSLNGVSSVPAPLEPSPFIEWLKADFMMKIGALLLLLALGWFVSYAFANNWIGEAGRITLGLLMGAVVMVLGLWRISRYPQQGGVFTVLGSTTVILTLYAARELYDFFTPVSALMLMFMTVVFVAFVSIRYDRKFLALSSLLLGGAAPLLIANAQPSVFGLNLYLLILVLGTLWVVYLRGWSLLTLTSFFIVALYGLPTIMLAGQADAMIGLTFAFIFTTIFFIANIIGLVINETEENKQYHIAIAFSSGVYLILWVIGAAPEVWQSLILTAWMLVFSVGAFLVYQTIGNKALFYIYGATSVVLLATATALELSGPALTIAFTFEAAALTLVSLFIFPHTTVAHRMSTLFIVPILLSVGSIFSWQWTQGLFHSDFVVLFVLAAALVTTGIVLRSLSVVAENTAAKALLVSAALYGLLLIWLVLHAGTLPNTPVYEQGTIISLVLYTIIGTTGYIVGVRTQLHTLKTLGAVIIGAVVARLLFIDVWEMALAARITTFFLVGVLLISTAFIRRHNTTANSPRI